MVRSLLVLLSLLSYSNLLSMDLESIIHNGTLDDFKLQEQALRQTANANTLEQGIDFHCIPRIDALQKANTMHTHPIIGDMVDYLYVKATNQETSIAFCSHNYSEDTIKDFTLVALGIAHCLVTSNINREGEALENIRERLKVCENPKQYLQDEYKKVSDIKTALQNILDTEFEPPYTIDYKSKLGVCPYSERKRKIKKESGA